MDNQYFKELSHKKIVVLGYGVEGKSVVKFLSRHRIKDILVFDEKSKDVELKECDKAVLTNKEEELKAFAPDIVFRSPGFKLARVRRILPKSEISSATKLFMRCKKGTTVGITGTKGKSTTAKLIEAILKLNDREVFLGGNIGSSPLDFVDELSNDSFSVIELSSFQLMDLDEPPEIAVILPVVVDHLDYHESVDEYINAKKMIISKDSSQLAIVPARETRIIEDFKGRLVTYSVEDDHAICAIKENSFSCGESLPSFDLEQLSERLVVPQINLACALSFCFAVGLRFDIDKIEKTFFKPEFRLQLVRRIGEIKFYNDTASTNPISTIEAAKIIKEKYILICGGSSKGLEYQGMADFLVKQKNLVKVLLFGQTAVQIETALIRSGMTHEKISVVETLDEAMNVARNDCDGIASIVFSPASASFDQFKNYKQRGQVFNELVEKWPNI